MSKASFTSKYVDLSQYKFSEPRNLENYMNYASSTELVRLIDLCNARIKTIEDLRAIGLPDEFIKTVAEDFCNGNVYEWKEMAQAMLTKQATEWTQRQTDALQAQIEALKTPEERIADLSAKLEAIVKASGDAKK